MHIDVIINMKSENNDSTGLAVFIVAILIALYSFYEKIKPELIRTYNEFLKAIPMMILFIITGLIIVVILYFLLNFIIKNYKRKKEWNKLEINFLDSLKKCKNIEELDNLSSSSKKLKENYSEDILELKNKFLNEERLNELENIKQYEHSLEKQKQEELRIRKEKKDKQEKINKLFEYYVEKESLTSIPKFAIDYSSELVNQAKREYNNIKEKSKLKEKVITHLLKYKSLPGDFHDLELEEKELYKKYLNFNEFELYDILKKPIGNRFFITKEVDPFEREKLSKIGFRNYSMPNPKKSNGFIPCFIFNTRKREGDYHFCLKNWFAKEFNGKTEVLTDNTRIDLVIDNIGFEIESGSNKDLQIAKNIEFLKNNYAEWFIICKRELKTKYSTFAPSSMILTPKEAYEYMVKYTEDKNKDI